MKHHQMDSGRGQVLIVTAAALMILIAIGAIVVDLGFSWMLRRQEQNAADPAAVAAARNGCTPCASNPPMMPDRTSPVPAVASRASPVVTSSARPSLSAITGVAPFKEAVYADAH